MWRIEDEVATEMQTRSSDSNGWKLWDFAVASGLFAVTAAFILWQNSRVAVLWDLGYLLNTSHRMALGQIPYRDFSLVHPPLTFLVQAVIERLFGCHYQLVIAYAALAGGLASVLSWRILLGVLRGTPHGWVTSLILAAPLAVVGIYSIYLHPVYDSDAALAVLAAVLLLQRCLSRAVIGWLPAAFAGVAVVLPLFVKQNIGLPFLLAVIAGLGVLVGLRLWSPQGAESPSVSSLLRLLAGIAAALAIALGLIQAVAGLHNYLYWTVQFAAQRRLPGVAEMLTVYQQPSFVWTIPLLAGGLIALHSRLAERLWGRVLGFALFSAPFVASLIYLLIQDDADERADNLLALWPLLLLAAAVMALLELRKGVTAARLIPFWVLAAIHGAFLSQQLWGSTYAVWPLLMVLAAGLLASLPERVRGLAPALAAVVCVTFLVCGGLYAASLERLDYIQIPEDQPLVRASLPLLQGLAAPGPFVPDFEELIRFTQREIPPQEGILLLPGEEPFFYATGRAPQFPVVLFDHTTDPYSADGLIAEAERRGVRWVIVKTRLQSAGDPLPERARTMQLLQEHFQLFRKLGGYDVYRSR